MTKSLQFLYFLCLLRENSYLSCLFTFHSQHILDLLIPGTESGVALEEGWTWRSFPSLVPPWPHLPSLFCFSQVQPPHLWHEFIHTDGVLWHLHVSTEPAAERKCSCHLWSLDLKVWEISQGWVQGSWQSRTCLNSTCQSHGIWAGLCWKAPQSTTHLQCSRWDLSWDLSPDSTEWVVGGCKLVSCTAQEDCRK